MDLILEYSVQEQEEIAQTAAEEGSEEPGSNDTPPDTDNFNRPAGVANWFPNAPSATKPEGGNSYTPNSSLDIENVENAGKTAVISNSFDCTGCTFAANQLIIPSGGSISGTNINLNGGYIDEVYNQAFSSSATFSQVYEDSWLSPEVFGGNANDATDDSSAITSLMKNVKFAKLSTSGTYIKNTPEFVSRQGDFIFDICTRCT